MAWACAVSENSHHAGAHPPFTTCGWPFAVPSAHGNASPLARARAARAHPAFDAPRAVPFVTEKVGFSVGLEPVEVGDDEDVRKVVDGLLNYQKVPTERYKEPVTSAQEVGWYTKPLVAANPRFMHGLQQGDATKFAETYTKKMAGEHMFHGKSGKYLSF
jgi:hypothetical protein